MIKFISRVAALLSTALVALQPALADTPMSRIILDDSGNLLFPGGPTIGKWSGGVWTLPSPTITGTLTAPGLTTNATGAVIPGQGGLVTALLSPSYTDTNTIGFFVNPIGYASTSTGRFLAAYNMQHGRPSTPVPAGTKGNLSGYECNQNLMQTVADVTEGSHCFGGTFVTGNGAPFNGMAMTGTINNVQANMTMINLNIANNVPIATAQPRGLFIGSTGSQPAAAGLFLHGTFVEGVELGGNNIRGATSIGFSGSGSYFIDGSNSATLNITGGGSAGGMILYGNLGTGTDGQIRFRNNAADDTQGASLDAGTGAFTSASTVTAATSLTAGTAANGVTITPTAITRLAAGANLSITAANQLVFTAAGGVAVGSPLSVSGGFVAVTTAAFQSNTKWTKIADATVAPGAGSADIRVVAGTTAGTCKLVVRAGTSTTPVTIADNVGSGC